MVTVKNCVQRCSAICKERYWRRNPRSMAYVVLHRIDFTGIQPNMVDAEEVAAQFAKTREFEPGAYTGGKIPYTFLVKVDGVIEQLTPLSWVTPHARKYNRAGLGVALVGDFRSAKPTEAQLAATVQLLAPFVARECKIVGHTDLPGAAADPHKICPGNYLDLDVIYNGASKRAELYETQGDVDGALLAMNVLFYW